jgi:hypothetical protein
MGASQSQPPYTPAPIHYQTGQECAYPSGISVVGSYPQRPGEADCSVCHFSWLYMIRMLKDLLAPMRKIVRDVSIDREHC